MPGSVQVSTWSDLAKAMKALSATKDTRDKLNKPAEGGAATATREAIEIAQTNFTNAWKAARKAYLTCLNGFFRKNESGFYVLGPHYKDGELTPDGNSSTIEVHFGNYPASASIDRLLSMFGLDAISEESNKLKYRSNMDRLLESAAESLETYRDLLVGDSTTTIEAATGTWLDTGTWPTLKGPAAKKPRPNIALVQLGVLARVARILAEDVPNGEAGKTQLAFQANALGKALEHTGSSIVRLSALARALRDEAIHEQVGKHLLPIAAYFERKAAQRLPWARVVLVLFGVGLFASALTLVVTNALFPAFGPTLSFGFIAIPLALAAGVGLLRSDAFATGWANRQKDIFRLYLAQTLRGLPHSAEQKDVLDALNISLEFVQKSSPVAQLRGPIGRLQVAVARMVRGSKGDTDKAASERSGDWTKVSTGALSEVLDTVAERSIPFDKQPEPPASEPSLGAMVLCFILVVFVHVVQVALPVTSRLVIATVEQIEKNQQAAEGQGGAEKQEDWPIAMALSRVLKDIAAPAQILRHTTGREACEVAEGRVVWQDETRIFLVDATASIVSVARTEMSEVRYGQARADIAPCATMSSTYADSDTTITNTPVAVNVPITTGGGGGDSTTTTTVSFQSNVVLDGKQITVNPKEPDSRYMILPLSLNPVDRLGNVVTNPDEYYDRAYRLYFSSKVTPLPWDELSPKFADEMQRQAQPIVQALHASAKAGCLIDIRVKGYASDSPFPAQAPEANYYLAEGRRAAVLWELGFRKPASNGLPATVEMTVSDKSKVTFQSTLTEITYESGGGLRLKDREQQIPKGGADRMVRRPTFVDEHGMTEDLGTWYAEPPEATTRLQESIARSAVIEVLGNMNNCKPEVKKP